jgi:prophage tail gpP-like protein
MPKANEICVVTVQGQKYDIWNTVEVHCSTEDVVDHALLSVSEVSTVAKNFTSLKLKPGDLATVTLAGQQVINGVVYLRQASMSATEHGVQIGICSPPQSALVATVAAAPGQYFNSTLQQIGSTVFGQVGVNFTVLPASGADLQFDRVSEHVGEEKFAFIERLCRMRNMHMVDDHQGGLIAFRGASNNTGLVLQEGVNIERGSITLKNPESGDPIVVVGQDHSQDSADANRDQNAQASGDPTVQRQIKIAAEHTGMQAEMQMRANHEADWIKFHMVDGAITVPGWPTPDSSLWFYHMREIVTVNSPLLLPEDSMDFMIKGIVHRQSSESGTTTDVLLCRFDGLGSGTGEPLA